MKWFNKDGEIVNKTIFFFCGFFLNQWKLDTDMVTTTFLDLFYFNGKETIYYIDFESLDVHKPPDKHNKAKLKEGLSIKVKRDACRCTEYTQISHSEVSLI